MNKKDEIELVLQLLREAWLWAEDLRLFQLLYNAWLYSITVDPCTWEVYAIDPYQVKNDQVIKWLEEFITKHNHG